MKLFGTFKGVFVPSYETILGAVVFLLLPHLTAELGLLPMLAIIGLSHVVTFSTSFSINDCASSVGRIGSGGMYALGKASLGKAFGGSIGIQLFLGQAASIGFYAMGFATPVFEVFTQIAPLAEFAASTGLSPLVQKQTIATVLLLLGTGTSLAGADATSKIQLAIFVILNLALLSLVAAPFLGLSRDGIPLFQASPQWWGSNPGYSFWVGLTIFFPAVTGIDAGVGMSGKLRDPRKSLAKGTFFSILVTFFIYVGLTFLFSFLTPAFLTGNRGGVIPTVTPLFSQNILLFVLLFTGIVAATASSALAYFLTAPQTAQALARDGILPKALSFMGKDFFKTGSEPRYAVIVTFIFSLVVIWSGDIAFSSRLVGIVFLMIYSLVNFAAFLERVSQNPSFRPSSYGHWGISFLGFVASLVLISMDSPILGAVILITQFILFFFILKFRTANRLEGVWWGFFFRLMTWSMGRLRGIIQGTKNWRPVVGVFTFNDAPESRIPTVQLARRIGHSLGIVSSHLLCTKTQVSEEQTATLDDSILINIYHGSPTDTLSSLTQAGLAGGLSYNTILMPFDPRFQMTVLMERLIASGKNVLLYKHSLSGQEKKKAGRIDIWWRGMENGSLMAILAHMMTRDESKDLYHKLKLRIIRASDPDTGEEESRQELLRLLDKARLEGDVVNLASNQMGIREMLETHSMDADLIMLGMPGKPSGPLFRFFRLDKLFFDQEIRKYEKLPPILFVKSAGILSLVDE